MRRGAAITARPPAVPPSESGPMVSAAARERFLNAPWLVDLDPASRQSLLQVLDERRDPAGAVLLERGHRNDRIAFLIEGAVAIERPFPDGRVELIANLTAPSVFGEMSFFRS